MFDLVGQINDLIGILEVVDPEAAKAFRNGAQRNTPAEFVPAAEVVPTPMPKPVFVQPTVQHTVSLSSDTSQTNQLFAPMLGTLGLNLPLTPDRLVEGIILAEILGKPVSKRARKG
ncbi:MAG: hypothetical protein PHC86_06810 [Eubacteriales bacterium]|nr:hypothetical protein [Eubacteriales bacterium]